jgi:membrane associated rhomboid family serine protease
MEPKRWRLSDDLVITFWATVGTFLGAGCCLGFAFLPVLFGAADDLPPPRDAPGMVAGGAAVVGAWIGLGVGLFLGSRRVKRRRE